MAIKLRANEEIKSTAHLHWSGYILPATWAAFLSFISLGALFAAIDNKMPYGNVPMFLIIGYLPLSIRWLQNKCKHYVITNQRLYVEQGILAKTKKDIPLQKINDLEMNQGILQRYWDAGNLLVLTGNDKPTILANISWPDVFKNSISEVMNHNQKNIA